MTQAHRVFSRTIVQKGRLDATDIDVVGRAKKDVIRESEALEYFDAAETPGDVGGLVPLKQWLKSRERSFSEAARTYGLPPPRGIALIGIPGTGKSLTAKMIGGLWRIPLLRLDVGALFGSFVGQSEERTRKALRLAEAVSPCVVWIDELDKAFGQGNFDGGTSKRVFGTILTWMQEKKTHCFVVATANDVESLPPELLRRGRFDEVFFLDLPTQQEREEIFTVHLRKRKREPRTFDVPALARAAVGFVGAEIEQALIDAMFIGFNDNARPITTADLLASIRRQVPLSISQKSKIEHLRKWLSDGRAQRASNPEVAPAVSL